MVAMVAISSSDSGRPDLLLLRRAFLRFIISPEGRELLVVAVVVVVGHRRAQVALALLGTDLAMAEVRGDERLRNVRARIESPYLRGKELAASQRRRGWHYKVSGAAWETGAARPAIARRARAWTTAKRAGAEQHPPRARAWTAVKRAGPMEDPPPPRAWTRRRVL